MRKSRYGKELAYFWTGNLGYESLTLETIPSTLEISASEEAIIKEAFKEAKAKNPQFFDGTLWRYEGDRTVRGGVQLLLSETTYMPHNILRKAKFPVEYTELREERRFNSHYPNPFSINALQRTLDGYFLIGVKGKVSDQTGELGVMGAGFIKRKMSSGKSLPPETVFSATLRECKEETKYKEDTGPTEKDLEDFRALGTIFGSNHDTTTCVYVPLNATKSEVDIGNQEHSDLLFLQDNTEQLKGFLNEGKIQGIPAVDHLIGCVELYLEHREALEKHLK